MLESLLSEDALKRGLPTVDELLETPLFRDVIPPLPVSCSIRMTPQCRELFRTVKAAIEQRLQQDQKLHRHQRRLDKTEALLNDEEKRRVRRQLQRKVGGRTGTRRRPGDAVSEIADVQPVIARSCGSTVG